MKILVTGCAGFIGFHLCKKLLSNSNIVYGLDNLNNYYDAKLKKDRLNILLNYKKFYFTKIDISNLSKLKKYFEKHKFDKVINLAAQAGVRYSIKKPKTYFDSNILGFYNILSCSQEYKIKHLIYASTSSIYGNTNNFPTKEIDDTNSPLSFYAASKKTNEVMSFAFSNIHKLKTTGLRFFTVYGPYGRPDMAIYKFTKSIKNQNKLDLFNNGNHFRDFTYIDDVVEIISKLMKNKINYEDKNIPYSVFNVGNSKTVKITKIIKFIEDYYNKKAKIKNLNLQKGDVFKTHADVSNIFKVIKIQKKTSINEGIKKYLKWYERYYD